jgi:hypothetical protein
VAADFAADDTVRREVVMTPEPVEIDGIVATSWGRSMRLHRVGYYERQQRGLGAFLGRDRLDQIRPARAVEAFRHMRGFKVLPRGPHQVVMDNRGGGCLPQVYIDGTKMMVTNARDQAQALNMASPDDIEAIEAYLGPAIPVEYNPVGSVCGVILIWTRVGG